MQMDVDFDGMISWPAIRDYLARELQRVRAQMEDVDNQAEMYRLQGESRRLRRCLNLPAAIAVTQEEKS